MSITRHGITTTIKIAAVTTALVTVGAGTAFAAGGDEAQAAPKFRALPFSDSTDASLATANASDPDVCLSGPSTASVWYRFQPKADGPVTIDTQGSNYDTVLAVFTSAPGQSAKNLTLVGCNDDVAFPDVTSQVQFDGVRNETYFIMVDTFVDSPARDLVLNAS